MCLDMYRKVISTPIVKSYLRSVRQQTTTSSEQNPRSALEHDLAPRSDGSFVSVRTDDAHAPVHAHERLDVDTAQADSIFLCAARGFEPADLRFVAKAFKYRLEAAYNYFVGASCINKLSSRNFVRTHGIFTHVDVREKNTKSAGENRATESAEPSARYCVLYERARGRSLAEFVRAMAPADCDDLLAIVVQVMLALTEAQRKFAFVHNDLHCGNVIVEEGGGGGALAYDELGGDEAYRVRARFVARIIDYGYAKVNYRDVPVCLTDSRDVGIDAARTNTGIDAYRFMMNVFLCMVRHDKYDCVHALKWVLRYFDDRGAHDVARHADDYDKFKARLIAGSREFFAFTGESCPALFNCSPHGYFAWLRARVDAKAARSGAWLARVPSAVEYALPIRYRTQYVNQMYNNYKSNKLFIRCRKLSVGPEMRPARAWGDAPPGGHDASPSLRMVAAVYADLVGAIGSTRYLSIDAINEIIWKLYTLEKVINAVVAATAPQLLPRGDGDGHDARALARPLRPYLARHDLIERQVARIRSEFVFGSFLRTCCARVAAAPQGSAASAAAAEDHPPQSAAADARCAHANHIMGDILRAYPACDAESVRAHADAMHAADPRFVSRVTTRKVRLCHALLPNKLLNIINRHMLAPLEARELARMVAAHGQSDVDVFAALAARGVRRKYNKKRNYNRVRAISALHRRIQQTYARAIETVVDVGGATGELTNSIAKYFGIGASGCFNVDVIDYEHKPTDRFSYVMVEECSPLPFADASVDLVVCLQSLHHIGNVGLMVREFARVLRPGAHVIVREHNVSNELVALLCDIEHEIYERCVEAAGSGGAGGGACCGGCGAGGGGLCNYRSDVAWTRLFASHSFARVDSYYQFHRDNVTNNFYHLYRLKAAGNTHQHFPRT